MIHRAVHSQRETNFIVFLGNLTNTLEDLSPHAAAAASLIKKGMTLTQIYTEYASVSEQLMITTHDNQQMKLTFQSFIEVSKCLM